jgi:hypothetical protein
MKSILQSKYLQIMVFLLFAFVQSQAQITIQVGTGTTTNGANSQPCPYGAWYSQSRFQTLILASELNVGSC